MTATLYAGNAAVYRIFHSSNLYTYAQLGSSVVKASKSKCWDLDVEEVIRRPEIGGGKRRKRAKRAKRVKQCKFGGLISIIEETDSSFPLFYCMKEENEITPSASTKFQFN